MCSHGWSNTGDGLHGDVGILAGPCSRDYGDRAKQQ
jgi:hypothetical protein